MLHDLTGREFKMLLNADIFPQNLSRDDANAFWGKQLEPIITRELGSLSILSAFADDEHRTVRFWDTADCMLTKAALNLRLREQPEKPEKPGKLTLKLRMPENQRDHVASTVMPGLNAKEDDTKFEEDVGPSGSKFALSTTIKFDWGKGTHTIDELKSVFSTIPTLAAASNLSSYGLPLQSGPVVRELVFEKATVQLEGNVKAGFDLTIWDFETIPEKRIAEISFSYEIGPSPELNEKRARALFKALNGGLQSLAATQSSKTALALPNLCGQL